MDEKRSNNVRKFAIIEDIRLTKNTIIESINLILETKKLKDDGKIL